MTATPTARTSTAKERWATGLIAFGAVMLMLTGLLDIFRGIMAIAQDSVFVVTSAYVFRFDLTGWGWIHVILGAVAVAVSVGLLRVAPWARVAGVGIAALIIIANFLSLPYSPIWSIVVIAFSALIIWALCVARQDESSSMFG
ncbi:hypothetical protein ABZ923_01065 [Streptomyces sp. NPDC046881]|uniref:DUF7144 family membrane protein n=1 Tax=Streptomyces sp. NPDC046881 TaxID=3155374 RepID=UPI0033F0C94B